MPKLLLEHHGSRLHLIETHLRNRAGVRAIPGEFLVGSTTEFDEAQRPPRSTRTEDRTQKTINIADEHSAAYHRLRLM
ncbi:MAG: hypothetical protein DWQ45_24870 [Planctomycetota bacterium]|nr:MAG: hypothetical protein DWQ41_24960 [Planctomycetota bacterium]REK28297.1 MAG: hypothetical protein DWQ45_24870 [Planctomycetota bacterium]